MTDQTTNIRTEVEAAFELGGIEPLELIAEHLHAGVYPAGWRAVSIDTEALQPYPRRKVGTAEFDETASLIAYISQQDGAADTMERPTIYVQPRQLRAVAVFDDDLGHLPGWRAHRAVLQLRHTDEWKAWVGINRRFVSGEEFAEFIEEWRHTIADPPSADIVEMVRSFRATQRMSFRDEVTDSSGDRSLEYTTDTTAAAGKAGTLPIPDGFGLVLSPFDGAEARPLPARFRYRLAQGGGAAFGVVLEQPDQVARAAFQQEVDRLEAAGLTVLVGEPAPAR